MKSTYVIESRIRATDLATLSLYYEHKLSARSRSGLVREAIRDLVEILDANGRLPRRIVNVREAFITLEAKFGDAKEGD